MIRPDSYPQSESPGVDHQFGSYKDETAVGANDGTGLFKDQIMDLFQPWANLFTKHSITPSNVKEKQSVSQVTEALDAELNLTAGNVDTLDANGTYTVDFDNKNGVLLLESPLTAVTVSPGAGVNEGNRLLVQNNTGGSVTVTAGVAIVLADNERVALFYNTHLAAYVTTLGNNIIFGIFKNLSTIDASDKDTASIVTEGGVAAEKKIHAGDTIKCDSATDATTKDSAAIVAVNGGIAAEKSLNAGTNIFGKNNTMELTDPTPYLIAQQGNDLPIAANGFDALAALSSNRIAFIDNGNLDLRTYDFDGTDWAQVGNDLNIVGITGTPALAALSSNRVAFIDSGNADLRVYDFDGTDWAQVGNDLPIAGVSNIPALAALSSNRVAFIDVGNADLRTYDFDGTDWAQVGNDLNIAGIGAPALAALSSNRIAFIDFTNDDLRTYDFDGSDWAQVGNDLNLATVGTPVLATLSENKVAFIDNNNYEMRTYSFDGTDWVQVGNILAIAGSPTGIAITTMNASQIAFIDATNDDLRIYFLNWSYTKTRFELF